jgi:predicted transcriptional regulator
MAESKTGKKKRNFKLLTYIIPPKAPIYQEVDDTYGGNLPRFITAFANNRKLTDKQAEEIKRLIDAYREGNLDG